MGLYLGFGGGGGGGEIRTVVKQVSLHRLRMNVVHLTDSAEGIIDAVAEAQADSPRLRFVIEEDALGNYWDWEGTPHLIRDGDDDFWPDGEDLFLSILTPSDLPTVNQIWFQDWSNANSKPFVNLAPTARKTDFAVYDNTTYSAYTVNITERADDQTAASNSGRGNAPATGYLPTQTQWKAGGNYQFFIWMNEVQFDFSAA